MDCGIALSLRYYTLVTLWVGSAHLRLFEMCVLGPLVNPDIAFLVFCPITLKDSHLSSPGHLSHHISILVINPFTSKRQLLLLSVFLRQDHRKLQTLRNLSTVIGPVNI